MKFHIDDSAPIAALNVSQLKVLIAAAVVSAQVEARSKLADGVERVSAGRAAAIAKKGRGLVLTACSSGALPAKRDGTRWSIRIGDLDAWCSAGFPTSK